jgi:hypothetical protein
MSETQDPSAVKRLLVENLDRTAKILLEGVEDLSDKELLDRSGPFSTPTAVLEQAVAGLHSFDHLLLTQQPLSEPPKSSEKVDIRKQYRDDIRRVLNRLAEWPAKQFSEPFAAPVELDMPGPAVKTLAEGIWGITAYIAMLAGDIYVSRVELGKPELERQRKLCF